jgi:glucose-1-phosphate thymidylyltransferase
VNEITSFNKELLERCALHVGIMSRETAWLDIGTLDSLNDTCEFVRVIRKFQRQKIGCLEEVHYRHVFIKNNEFVYLRDIKMVDMTNFREFRYMVL